MQITINIDVEAIVADEIRKCVREALVINNTKFNKSYDEAVEKAFEEEKNYIQNDVLVPVILSDEQHKQIEEVCKDKVINTSTLVHISDESEYEYAPRKDKRRNKVEIALHDAELAVKRRLTPEEKVKIKAAMEREEEQEQKEIEAAKTRMKAEKLAKKLTEDMSNTIPTTPLFNPEPEKENSELIKDNKSWSLPSGNACSTREEDEEMQIAMEKASTGEEEDSSAWFSTKVSNARETLTKKFFEDAESQVEEITTDTPDVTSLFKPSIDDPVIPKADPLIDINSLFKD